MLKIADGNFVEREDNGNYFLSPEGSTGGNRFGEISKKSQSNVFAPAPRIPTRISP